MIYFVPKHKVVIYLKGKLNYKLLLSTVGFLMIGLSMFFPKHSWLIITGALFFALGMFKKPKKG